MKSLSCVQLFATPWAVACTRLLRPWAFLGKSTRVGCHFLLQGIFLTQGSNPGLPHCRQTLHQWNCKGLINHDLFNLLFMLKIWPHIFGVFEMSRRKSTYIKMPSNLQNKEFSLFSRPRLYFLVESIFMTVCECVCVCKRERERERETDRQK